MNLKERGELLTTSLHEMVGVIVKKYKPERIVLFGSLAKNCVHEGSDIDLLIIKETKDRFIERQMKVYGMVKPKVGIDLFIYTPKEFDYLISEGISFTREIINEGKVLYEAWPRGYSMM